LDRFVRKSKSKKENEKVEMMKEASDEKK